MKKVQQKTIEKTFKSDFQLKILQNDNQLESHYYSEHVSLVNRENLQKSSTTWNETG